METIFFEESGGRHGNVLYFMVWTDVLKGNAIMQRQDEECQCLRRHEWKGR